MYVHHGVPRGLISKKLISDWSAFAPPYREPYCQNRPLLEMMEGARLVSPVASWAAERIESNEQASRMVLVLMEAYNEN